MRLDKFIKTLPDGVSSLFNSALTYPEPFDNMAELITRKAVRDFGGLKIMPYIKDMELSDLQELIWDELTLNTFQLAALNKIMDSLTVDAETPDKIEVRTYGTAANTKEYGQETVTNNIGARSSTDTLGATDGTTSETGTSYESVVGKATTTSRTQTQQVTNGTTSTAAVDSTVSAAHTDTERKLEHTDTIEHYNNVGEDDAPDYIAKWSALLHAPILVSYEKLIVDALTMPYYEED